jgi:hypothetical protein
MEMPLETLTIMAVAVVADATTAAASALIYHQMGTNYAMKTQ